MIDNKKFQEYCRKAHEIATKHGFHEEKKSDAHWLCLIVCEIAEAVEADRKNRHADSQKFLAVTTEDKEYKVTDAIVKMAYEDYIKGSVEEEFADICIRIFDFAYEKYGENVEFIKWTRHGVSGTLFTERAISLIRWIGNEEVEKDMLSLFVIYMYDWAESSNIDLDWHIEAKMRYNSLRPYKHGKNY